MVDIPLGMALVPVETCDLSGPRNRACNGCYFDKIWCNNMACSYHNREDEKDVIFKLVEYKDGTAR